MVVLGITIVILGADPNGTSSNGHYFPMKLYSVRVYNRALMDEEIQQNYNIDKARFGL